MLSELRDRTYAEGVQLLCEYDPQINAGSIHIAPIHVGGIMEPMFAAFPGQVREWRVRSRKLVDETQYQSKTWELEEDVMKKKNTVAALCAAALLGLGACSPSAPPPAENELAAIAPAIVASDAWAAPTPNGVDIAAGYLTLTNSGTADTLVSVTSSRSPHVEIHEMTMDGAVMRMRPVASFTVPANGVVALTPGGYHLMFMDLPTPFVAGETVPVTLTFEHARAVEVSLTVRQPTAADTSP